MQATSPRTRFASSRPGRIVVVDDAEIESLLTFAERDVAERHRAEFADREVVALLAAFDENGEIEALLEHFSVEDQFGKQMKPRDRAKLEKAVAGLGKASGGTAAFGVLGERV